MNDRDGLRKGWGQKTEPVFLGELMEFAPLREEKTSWLVQVALNGSERKNTA